MLKAASVSFLCLAFFSGIITDSFARPPRPFTGSVNRFSSKDDCDQTADPIVVAGNDYQADIHELIALRSHPLDELLALANKLERKWRLINWDHYARVMIYVCSEISNRGLNDARVREQSEHFARVALSHSTMYLWEHESDLVGWFGHERSSTTDSAWRRERREKAELWLRAWKRLERQTDPSFDINDRKNQPSLRVYPPFETGLPPGTPSSAIKDPHLRAKYEAAIADNKRKSEKMLNQFPLQTHGPLFKTRAERWLIQAYSQPPAGKAELKRLLGIYLQDGKTHQRILSEVEKSAN
jgi:hypothetical protein